MLAGLREPGHRVDADQPAPRACLSPGAHDHAEAEGDQRNGHGEPKIDDHFRCSAHESGGRPERRVHHERAKERLPQLIGVRRPGKSTACPPCEQERNECQAKGNERQQPRTRLGRSTDVHVRQLQRNTMDQQPGLARQSGQGVHVPVLEPVGGPHPHQRKDHHNGGNKRCLSRFQTTL